jgi:hypothetical protein
MERRFLTDAEVGLTPGFIVIFPFCNNDGRLMARTVRWLAKLGGCKNQSALLAYDKSTLPDIIAAVRHEALACFGQVQEFVYATPPLGNMTQTAKLAFKAIACHIYHKVRRPYLWFEADMVALKRGWLDTLQAAYANCHKSFFGPVIPEMGHFNGTAVYPFDTWTRCRSLHVMNDDAWDTGMRDETRGYVADASHLIQHAWVRSGPRLLSCGYGELPYFGSVQDVQRMISKSAVLFHRDKNLTLVDRLTEMGVA